MSRSGSAKCGLGRAAFRIAVFCVVASTSTLSAQSISRSDSGQISVHAEGVPIGTLLRELTEVAPIERLLVDPNVEQNPVSIVIENVTLAEAVRQILNASGLNFVAWGGGLPGQPLRLFVGAPREVVMAPPGAAARVEAPVEPDRDGSRPQPQARNDRRRSMMERRRAGAAGPGQNPSSASAPMPWNGTGTWGGVAASGSPATPNTTATTAEGAPDFPGSPGFPGSNGAVAEGAPDPRDGYEASATADQNTPDSSAERRGGGGRRGGATNGSPALGGEEMPAVPTVYGGLDTYVTSEYTMIGESVTYHDPDFVPYKNTEAARKAREAVDVSTIP